MKTTIYSLFLSFFLLIGASVSAANFYCVSPWDGNVYVMDDVSLTTSSTYLMTNASGAVLGANGLSIHPTTGVYYIILKIDGLNGRYLGTLNPLTGATITIGKLNENFSAITFSCDGTLFGVSGDGSSTSESLFSIDISDASITFLLSLGNGDDGEVICYNYDDGLIYHGSGLSTAIWETIDPNTLTVSNVGLSGDNFSEMTSLTYLGSGMFYFRTYDSDNLYEITSGGLVGTVGVTDIDTSIKGMQNQSTMASCGGQPVPLGNWGIFLAIGAMILFSILFVRRKIF